MKIKVDNTMERKGSLQERNGRRSPPRILLAEDDSEMRALLARALRRAGYEVRECANGIELLEHLEVFCTEGEIEKIDLVISDIRMPGLTGLEVLEGLREEKGFPPMILITAFGDEETHAEAERYGAVAMFDKPFDIDELIEKVREVVPVYR